MAIDLKKLPPALAQSARRFDKDGSQRLDEDEEYAVKLAAARARKAPSLADGLFQTDAGRTLAELVNADCSPTREQALEAFARSVSFSPFPADGRPAAARPTGDLERLTAGQRLVLRSARAQSKANAEAARPRLIERFEKLGYSEAQMDRALAWLGERAQLTVNFNGARPGIAGDCVEELRQTGGYVSPTDSQMVAHQLPAGGGRAASEERVYAGLFAREGLTAGEDRPKYAAVNLFGDPRGAMPFFGDDCLVLKPEVAGRCAFLPQDVGQCGPQMLGTADHLEAVALNLPTDDALHVLVARSGAGRPTAPLRRPALSEFNCLEAHVFGPLSLAKDVEALVCNNRVAKDEAAVQERRALAEQHGIPLFWTDGRRVWLDLDGGPQPG